MDDDGRAIRALIAAWLDATRAGDTEAILGLMTEDVVFLVAGQPPMRGKPAVAAAQRALAGAPSDVQEIVVAGDFAYAWTNLAVVMSPPDGVPVRRSGSTLSIFRRDSGAWRLHRDANLLQRDAR